MATLKTVLLLGPWRPVNVGRTQRRLPPWLRDVLYLLHRHCRGPGCDRPGSWSEAHHVTEWSAGGHTDLNDSLPLCCTHHGYITVRGWQARLDHATGEVIWTSPNGRVIALPPPAL